MVKKYYNDSCNLWGNGRRDCLAADDILCLDRASSYTGAFCQNSVNVHLRCVPCIWTLYPKEKTVNRYWNLANYTCAEVYRGICIAICNLLWNASKK